MNIKEVVDQISSQENLGIFMNLMTDFAFKRLFGSVERKGILIRFLNTLFKRDGIVVYDVIYKNKEILPDDIDGKRLQRAKESWEECEDEYDEITYLIKNMHKMDKESAAYKSKKYEDLFRESEINNMVKEDVVAYSQSKLRLEEIQESYEWSYNNGLERGFTKGIEQGIEQGRAEGRTEGIEQGKREFVHMLIDNGMNVSQIAKMLGITEQDIEYLVK